MNVAMNPLATSTLAIPIAPYRGRMAPSPSGMLHLGHAATFWVAYQKVRTAQGSLIYRDEDLDTSRCRKSFLAENQEDLRWLGIVWDEGPDIGGNFGPYSQSERIERYRLAFHYLMERRLVYPCSCTRKDMAALSAPNGRGSQRTRGCKCRDLNVLIDKNDCNRHSWRFRVQEFQRVSFFDNNLGLQTSDCGDELGDFVVWTQSGLPSYQLACVVDDAAMQITEVVRGADLIESTFWQLLLYEALTYSIPQFFHCQLVCDEDGRRLAKRSDSHSIKALRNEGLNAEDVRKLAFNRYQTK